MVQHDRVFVFYPRGIKTGGPEALHQLVHSLRGLGVDAYLVPTRGTRKKDDVLEFAHYACPVVSEVPDEVGVRVVAPETSLRELLQFERAQPMIWWLSIDDSSLYFAEKLRDRQPGVGAHLRVVARRLRRERQKMSVYRSLVHRAHNMTQSHYAWAHLVIREGVTPAMLSDFTIAEHAPVRAIDSGDRGRTIAYNPKKGAQLLGEVRQLVPDAQWLPIENMSSAEVALLLASAAVYLDLGHHPGKDRIPREAALGGAVVVVGRRGSASFRADVPVDERCKVVLGEGYAARTANVLREVLSDTLKFQESQGDYVDAILAEKAVFEQEVASIFVHGQVSVGAL